jgi:hypothetical protein
MVVGLVFLEPARDLQVPVPTMLHPSHLGCHVATWDRSSRPVTPQKIISSAAIHLNLPWDGALHHMAQELTLHE